MNEDFSIDLKTAQTWAKRWRKVEGSYNAHHELHAFLIPKEDIVALSQQEGVDAIQHTFISTAGKYQILTDRPDQDAILFQTVLWYVGERWPGYIADQDLPLLMDCMSRDDR